MTTTLRYLGLVIAAGVAGSLALGLVFGLAQEESVLRWIAYMLYILGALAIGFAALAGSAAPRRAARKRLIDREEDTGHAQEHDRPFVSDRLVLAVGGAILFGAGTLLEISL